MRMQVGIGTEEEFWYFLEKGADEFYCGLKNVPGHLYGGENFETEEEITRAIKISHKNGKKFFLAANEIQSTTFDDTILTIRRLVKNNIDGIIIRDITMLERLKALGVKTDYILSSLSLCFNEKCLEFYKNLGVTRLALPEQLLPREAKGLVKNKFQIETEVFLGAREYCVVFNGFCYLKQFNGKCICRSEFSLGSGGKFMMARPSNKEHFSNLYDFYKLGAPILKIGRHPTKDYAKLVFAQGMMINKLLESGVGKKVFIREALKYNDKVNKILKKWNKR